MKPPDEVRLTGTQATQLHQLGEIGPSSDHSNCLIIGSIRDGLRLERIVTLGEMFEFSVQASYGVARLGAALFEHCYRSLELVGTIFVFDASPIPAAQVSDQ